MRIAVVMPRGSLMDRGRTNSMETVAVTLNAGSRFRDDVWIICDAGAADPARLDLLTIPAGLGKAARTKAVATRLRDLAPDIVEYHQQLGPAAELARKVRGPMHVLYRHTRIKPPGNPIERFRYRKRLETFDHLLFVSEAACDEFRADYPKFKGAISAVCNPIDVEAWRGDAERREKLILFSGRAMADKGLDAFCEALAAVLGRHPDWRGALMLGDWEKHAAWATPHVAALTARFGDRVEVHRSAPLAEVMAATRRAAIAVTPSRVAEALGLTALEAQAAGAALISSGRGGLREASGDHALYVDPPEAPGLIEAMERLIGDEALRLTLARGGQAHVAATHTPAVRTVQLDDLRQRLDDDRRGRSGLPGRSAA
ncbi:MAG: glycosyltransferase [Brevundimonas sp.]|nr:MAG: glycosyltransferase [Brevundimonas sp.]